MTQKLAYILTKTYKIPLLISFTVAVVLIALKAQSSSVAFTAIILGSLLGTFVLDLEYFIYAYFLEPDADFSKSVVSFMKHGDIVNAFYYVDLNKSAVGDKILNSAIFQVVLGAVMVFVSFSNSSIFMKSLVFSAFAGSLYKFAEAYYDNKLDDWFWILKGKPTKNLAVVYSVVLIVVFIYCLSLF